MTLPVNTIANEVRAILTRGLSGRGLPLGAALEATDGVVPQLVAYVRAAEARGQAAQLTRDDRTSHAALFGYQAGLADGHAQALDELTTPDTTTTTETHP